MTTASGLRGGEPSTAGLDSKHSKGDTAQEKARDRRIERTPKFQAIDYEEYLKHGDLKVPEISPSKLEEWNHEDQKRK